MSAPTSLERNRQFRHTAYSPTGVVDSVEVPSMRSLSADSALFAGSGGSKIAT